MSQQNVELTRRAILGWNERGVDALVEALHPKVEFHPPKESMEPGVYRGHAGVRDYFGRLSNVLDEQRVASVDIIDIDDDHLVAVVQGFATGPHFGAEVAVNWAWLIAMKDGKASVVKTFTDRGQALEAAGLSEQAVSEENVTTLLSASKAASEATSLEERSRFLAILDPDVEWIARAGPPDLQGEFHGIEQARHYYARWASAWEEWGWEIEEAREQDDLVVTRTWLTGRGRGSGLALDMRIGQVWSFRDGRVIRYEAFSSWGEALEAAGLSE